MESNNFEYSASMADMQYEIESSEPKDGGQYTCIVSNEYGVSNESVQIDIMPTPLVVSIPDAQYIGTEKQSQLKIPCSILVSIKFRPRVKWYFNGAEIVADGNTYEVI